MIIVKKNRYNLVIIKTTQLKRFPCREKYWIICFVLNTCCRLDPGVLLSSAVAIGDGRDQVIARDGPSDNGACLGV